MKTNLHSSRTSAWRTSALAIPKESHPRSGPSRKPLALLCAVALSLCAGAHAAPFSSGSTGADGDLVVSNNLTLNLPPDGIFHFNTITVNANRTLTFNRNPLNTPVYLLAKSNVIISGRIDVSAKPAFGNYLGGLGGPGGYDGGLGGFVSGTNFGLGGAGLGPGGGRRGASGFAGSAGFRTVTTLGGNYRHGTNYGNPLLIPMVGGSGGGGIDGRIDGGGGGGGGAILIASDTAIRINNPGDILNRGGTGANGNSGSGGSIRLVSPRVYGNGILYVEGAGGSVAYGHGYIRIDSIFRTEPGDPSQVMALSSAPPDSTTLGGNMIVFPPNLPRLDVTAIGTNAIPFGTSAPAFFLFDVDSPTNQTVTIQARNFNNAAVPIEVALIPDSGEKTTFQAVIDNSTNPGQVVVPVTVTPNTKVEVQAWIR